MIGYADRNAHDFIVVITDGYQSSVQLLLRNDVFADRLKINDRLCAKKSIIQSIRVGRVGVRRMWDNGSLWNLMLHNWTFFIVEDRKENTVNSRKSLKFHGCSAGYSINGNNSQRAVSEILSQHERDCQHT